MPTDLTHLKNKVYYSQNREDLILEAFFPDESEGFYVDVGAYDPHVDSVTKRFYLKGWRGINIEPQLSRYKKFVRARGRDINVQCGISTDEGERTFRVYPNGGLSTFSESLQKAYAEEELSYHEVKMKMVALRTIFKQHKVNKIHFMKVDVEGLEAEVLRSNDWKRYRPEVICIEANHVIEDWRAYLREQEYQLVFDDGLNEYYADKQTSRAEVFDYVSHVINTRGGGIAFADYEVAKRLSQSVQREHAMAKAFAHDNERLTEEMAHKQAHLEKMNQILSSPRLLLRKLVRATINAIMRR